MNRDDIIRMARESEGEQQHHGMWRMHVEDLKRFAALVAAHTKQTCEAEVELQKQRAQLWRNEAYKLGGKPLPWDADEVLAKAVAAEREECARVAERFLLMHSGSKWDADHCAAAILARGSND